MPVIADDYVTSIYPEAGKISGGYAIELMIWRSGIIVKYAAFHCIPHFKIHGRGASDDWIFCYRELCCIRNNRGISTRLAYLKVNAVRVHRLGPIHPCIKMIKSFFGCSKSVCIQIKITSTSMIENFNTPID